MAPSKPSRPAASGYARLAQADEEEHAYHDDSDLDENPFATPPTISTTAAAAAASTSQSQQVPTTRHGVHWNARAPRRPNRYSMSRSYPHESFYHNRPVPLSSSRSKPDRRRRSDSGVDIKAINMRLERWAEEFASKFKLNKVRGKSNEEEKLEIHVSVFQPPDNMRPLSADSLEQSFAENEKERLSPQGFDRVVDGVRTAIDIGVHPRMISQGSSGSYFARNPEGKVVGVFKPKDEEPYASRNPKWTKWIHRNLFPCCFGRACLIPNLSYVSEAAAYVLDTRLQTNLIPYTDIVWLSSRSFYYDFWDRRKAWGGKPLPAKVGSFQVFLQGFKDANLFLRDNPWPDQANGMRSNGSFRRSRSAWNDACRTSNIASEDEEEEGELEQYHDTESLETPSNTSRSLRTRLLSPSSPSGNRSPTDQRKRFRWTEPLKQSFREELEKLVILDYIMRNTDRGLDNWMIKLDTETQKASIVSQPPKKSFPVPNHMDDEDDGGEDRDVLAPKPVDPNKSSAYYRRQEDMVASPRNGSTPVSASDSDRNQPNVRIGAIDNSLSWPWKHPDAWRSFPFGWLFLPVSLIGQPFSKKTRDHFLPLLTSKAWWSGTQTSLRRIFVQDADFKESMFARQIAVMKGQAWNVVETLKQPDHGPLELTRRTRVCVWDDLVDVPVAIPLHRPSGDRHRQAMRDEQRRQHRRERRRSIEEMDIGALGQEPATIPNDSPISNDVLNNNGTSNDLIDAGPSSLATDHRPAFSNTATKGHKHHNSRHKRNPSSLHRGHPSDVLFNADDLEGDLGYAAAEELERHSRRVIVERLETVKSKNPVFSWC